MAGRTALVVIDVQLGMFDAPGEPQVPGGGRLLERIKGLIVKARGTGAPVIYVQHCDESGVRFLTLRSPSSGAMRGCTFHLPVPSSSRPPGSFLDTTLREELVARNIDGLVFAGMQTEYCVDTTCRRAFSLGYEVTLVKDAHGTWDNDDLSAAQIIAHHNEVLGGGFAKALNADEVRFEEPATK